MPLIPPSAASLPAIITAARAGAHDHALALFDSAGFGGRTDDPGALAVKGRLLKDSALAAPPGDRAPLFAEAARAYAAADALLPQPYTRINVATLTLLAGDAQRAAVLASDMLEWMDGAGAIAETPYYLAATRAEAELLRGTHPAAEALLVKAIGHDPDGWADRASTIRQLGLIGSARGEAPDWLDRFRPPVSLHYAGHLAIAAHDHSALSDSVTAEIEKAGVGFGYGALAAGSDIVTAEALLGAGAALHVVLPTAIDVFIAQSVAPYGGHWLRRFHACLSAATSIRSTGSVTGRYEPLATELASDIAMGGAVLNASLLASSAMQLLVIDDGPGRYGEGRGTARDGERWARSGRAQVIVRAPRSAPVVASCHQEREGRPDRRLTALLHIAFEGLDALDDGAFADALDTIVAPFRDRMVASPVAPDVVLPIGNARIVAFATPEAAWAYATPLLAEAQLEFPLRIAAHYGLAYWLSDPVALVGRTVTELGQIAAVALPGIVTVSEAFATALIAASDEAPCAQPVGEVGDLTLLALSAPQ